MRIRTATKADIDELLEVERLSFGGIYKTHQFEVAQFRSYLRNRSARLLVGEDGDRLTGYVLGTLGNGRRQHLCNLISIAVHPKLRRRGMARALLREFLEICREAGRSVVVAETWVDNRAALDLFQSHGFVESGQLPDYYDAGVAGIRLRLVPSK